MFHIALLEPEIPPNTGNIIRLCVATGAALHVIGRAGFPLGERTVRRAAVDYWDEVSLTRHATLEEFEASRTAGRIFCFSAHVRVRYTAVAYQPGDSLLFGRESTGLPASVVARHGERALCIPMPAGKVRSLNLANAREHCAVRGAAASSWLVRGARSSLHPGDATADKEWRTRRPFSLPPPTLSRRP